MILVLFSASIGLTLVFLTFFFWNRLALGKPEAWLHGLVGALLACMLFVMCFALGIWFSISRLKGLGWMPSV
jgi:hypothetical protein